MQDCEWEWNDQGAGAVCAIASSYEDVGHVSDLLQSIKQELNFQVTFFSFMSYCVVQHGMVYTINHVWSIKYSWSHTKHINIPPDIPPPCAQTDKFDKMSAALDAAEKTASERERKIKEKEDARRLRTDIRTKY